MEIVDYLKILQARWANSRCCNRARNPGSPRRFSSFDARLPGLHEAVRFDVGGYLGQRGTAGQSTFTAASSVLYKTPDRPNTRTADDRRTGTEGGRRDVG